MFGNAKGRKDPAPAEDLCAWQRAKNNPARENLQVSCSPPFQRLALGTTCDAPDYIPALIRHDGALVAHRCPIDVALALPSRGRA
jgi:hypothetical protein